MCISLSWHIIMQMYTWKKCVYIINPTSQGWGPSALFNFHLSLLLTFIWIWCISAHVQYMYVVSKPLCLPVFVHVHVYVYVQLVHENRKENIQECENVSYIHDIVHVWNSSHAYQHLTLLLGLKMASPMSILANSFSASLKEALRNAGCTITRLMYPAWVRNRERWDGMS